MRKKQNIHFHYRRSRDDITIREKKMALYGNLDYDRANEAKQFDDTKMGIKGLVDSGVTTIPRLFVLPPEIRPSLRSPSPTHHQGIPTIDLSGLNSHRRSAIVKQIREASSTWGFFQIINHGISTTVLDETIAAINAFHEQPMEEKARLYSRESGNSVMFNSNLHLFCSETTCWADTLRVAYGSSPMQNDLIPSICRKEVVAWDKHINLLAEILMELLCEGLGVDRSRLKEMTCLEDRKLFGHYYPYCPQPDLTLGAGVHTDSSVLTVLLQDQIGGLQAKHGDEWVDVKPMHGALIVNIGDLLQLISNDEYKSVQHRVLANASGEPRISIAMFYRPGKKGESDYYGPLPELVLPEKPALYQKFTLPEFLSKYHAKDTCDKSYIKNFRQ